MVPTSPLVKQKYKFSSDYVVDETNQLNTAYDAEQEARREEGAFDAFFLLFANDLTREEKKRRSALQSALAEAEKERVKEKLEAMSKLSRLIAIDQLSRKTRKRTAPKGIVAAARRFVIEFPSNDLRDLLGEIRETSSKIGFTPMHHFQLLHGHQTRPKQWVSICKKTANDPKCNGRKPWQQWMYRQDDFLIHDHLDGLGGSVDTYISANAFHRPKRYSNHLSSITSVYFDIDNVEEKLGMSKALATAKLLKAFDDKKVPRPTVIFDSGKGLHVYFVLEDIQRDCKSRKWKLIWNKIADIVDQCFSSKGGSVVDRSVSDVARVLRLAGTINSKNNAVVKPLYVTGDYLTPQRISFVKLGDAVLDLTDAEWRTHYEEKVKTSQPDAAATPNSSPAITNTNKEKSATGTYSANASNTGKKKFCRRSFAITVMEDLQKLSRAGYVTEGKFDHWLLLYSAQLACIARSGTELRQQILEAAKIHNWNLDRAMAVMGSVIARAEAAYSGKKEEYNGRVKDPRYEYSAKRMVELLGLKNDTILDLDLRALVTSEIRQERDRLRKAKYRNQTKAAQSQAEVAAERKERSELILDQLNSGTSASIIAITFGVSRQTVYNIKQRYLGEQAKSLQTPQSTVAASQINEAREKMNLIAA